MDHTIGLLEQPSNSDWRQASDRQVGQGNEFKRGMSPFFPLTIGELEQVRQSVNRGTPYGSYDWVARTAEQLGLEASIRPTGRPRK